MKKSIWDRFAPVYSLAMKSQQSIYDYMYARIRTAVEAKDVLELATGPGLIAKHVAGAAAHITATDFSPQMIAQAKKGSVKRFLLFCSSVMLGPMLSVMPSPMTIARSSVMKDECSFPSC